MKLCSDFNVSNKEVCSEYLHNVSSNYQQRISEWGERKRASATADKSSANMQERAGKPVTAHVSREAKHKLPPECCKNTLCSSKANSMYLRQFLIIHKNTLKTFLGKTLMNVIKNDPLPKGNAGGRPFTTSSSLSTSDEVRSHPWKL